MNKQEKAAAGLLGTLIVLCFIMVTIGGYVRLTGSGLSIPEWPVFTIEETVRADGSIQKVRAVIPPRTEEGWMKVRETFVKKIPGADEGISLSAFQRMFWIEWTHRAFASLIMLVYLAFMFVALRNADLRPRIGKLAVGGFFLLISQAVIGGIIVFLHLVAVKVAIHLVIAFLFTSLLLWALLKVVQPPVEASQRSWSNSVSVWALAVYAIIVFQIFSGGLMAASHAGYQMNTWPKMGDFWVPPGMHAEGMGLFRNFVENTIMIQFFHRWFAILTAVAILLFVFRCMTVRVTPAARWALRALFAVVVLQITLGVLTLLTGVQPHLALTHQSVGLLLMLVQWFIVYQVAMQPVLTEERLVEEAEARENARKGVPANA